MSLTISSLLYQNTISRVTSGIGGVGKHEAKIFHHRAYGGLVCHPSISTRPCVFHVEAQGEITHMLPQEVGPAAAYEAYRQLKYGSGMYQFLYGDYERQREALRGLAIAEGMTLSAYHLIFRVHVFDLDIKR